MCESPSRILRTAASGRLTRSTSSFSESNRQSAPDRYGYKRSTAGSISRQEAIKQAVKESPRRTGPATFLHKGNTPKVVQTSDMNTPRFSERSRSNQEEIYS